MGPMQGFCGQDGLSLKVPYGLQASESQQVLATFFIGSHVGCQAGCNVSGAVMWATCNRRQHLKLIKGTVSDEQNLQITLDIMKKTLKSQYVPFFLKKLHNFDRKNGFSSDFIPWALSDVSLHKKNFPKF